MGLQQKYGVEFEMVWGYYPNKSKKLDGYKAWLKKIAVEDRDELLEHIRERATTDAAWARGYCPHFQTFINGCRWEDNYERIQKTNPKEKRYYDVEDPAEEYIPANPEIALAALRKAREALLKGELH